MEKEGFGNAKNDKFLGGYRIPGTAGRLKNVAVVNKIRKK